MLGSDATDAVTDSGLSMHKSENDILEWAID